MFSFGQSNQKYPTYYKPVGHSNLAHHSTPQGAVGRLNGPQSAHERPMAGPLFESHFCPFVGEKKTDTARWGHQRANRLANEGKKSKLPLVS